MIDISSPDFDPVEEFNKFGMWYAIVFRILPTSFSEVQLPRGSVKVYLMESYGVTEQEIINLTDNLIKLWEGI